MDGTAPTTFSGRQSDQDASAATRAAAQEPVLITDHGRPAHVRPTVAAN
ncbi:hypothetical protein [Acuticoccus sp.]